MRPGGQQRDLSARDGVIRVVLAAEAELRDEEPHLGSDVGVELISDESLEQVCVSQRARHVAGIRERANEGHGVTRAEWIECGEVSPPGGGDLELRCAPCALGERFERFGVYARKTFTFGFDPALEL